jgi:membrane-bound lytic murein transglycosylase D
MKGVISFFLILSLMVCPGTAIARGTTTHTGLPPLVESLRVKPPLDFCGERVPIDNRDVRERLDREMLLALWNRPQVILWIKRSNRHLPVIEKMLKDNNMPDDLKYITLIESALRPHVGSAKGAIGFWQFTEGTGIKYGLRIDADIDERRSVFASTRAALRCLKEFHEAFGSWTLAAAAFNMGKEGLQTEILAQKTDNYYHLYLPLQTQWYVLRIIAAKLIMTNPEKYGFHLMKDDLYPPLKYDRITLESAGRVPIQIIADAAKTRFKVVKDLNPEIRGYYLNKGNYTLSIPKGTSKRFYSQYKKLLKRWMAQKGKYIYVVKKGDNLSVIADRFGVPLPALFLWNNLKTDEPIHPGDRLVIYPNTKKTH